MSESNNVYRKITVVGSSASSLEDGIQNAVGRATSTIDNVEWFEVQKITGHVENGNVGHYQVHLEIGFRIENVNDN